MKTVLNDFIAGHWVGMNWSIILLQSFSALFKLFVLLQNSPCCICPKLLIKKKKMLEGDVCFDPWYLSVKLKSQCKFSTQVWIKWIPASFSDSVFGLYLLVRWWCMQNARVLCLSFTGMFSKRSLIVTFKYLIMNKTCRFQQLFLFWPAD